MPVFTDLATRLTIPPFDEAEYQKRLPDCQRVAERMCLVHVSGREVPLEETLAQPVAVIPTSADESYYTDATRKAEDLIGLPRSAYFYAGRAHPGFGRAAFAFSPSCERQHTGTVTPFDTGGVVHDERYIKLKLVTEATNESLAEYVRASILPLEQWREVFARVLAAYFTQPADYWNRPLPHDPENQYALNDDWRAWAFEIRFHEPQSFNECVAWCTDEFTMDSLRRVYNYQRQTSSDNESTGLDHLFTKSLILEPRATQRFDQCLEQWIREVCQ